MLISYPDVHNLSAYTARSSQSDLFWAFLLYESAVCASSRGLTAANWGNRTIRTATRRRHTDSQLLMLPNPHRYRWGAGGTGRPGCGARGRWRGLAGQRADAPSHTSAPQAPPVWRAPEGPEGTGGLRGAAPNEVRPPSLAGGRALRRPEHQRRNKQQK